MRKQSIILTLVCSIFILMPVAYSAQDSDTRRPEILGSAPLMREEIPADVVLVPLTSLGRAKAASLETFHEEKRSNPEKIILESLRTAEEDEEVRQALALSIAEAFEDEVLTTREAKDLETAISKSLSTSPENSLLLSSSTPSTSITEKKDTLIFYEDDSDFKLAQKRSEIEEESVQRQRELAKLREKSQALSARSESIWEQQKAVWEEQKVVDDKIMDFIMNPQKESGASSTLPLVGGERDDGMRSSIPPIPSHALRPLPSISSKTAAEEGSQVNTNNAQKKIFADDL